MNKAQDWNLLARDAVTLTAENISRLVKGYRSRRSWRYAGFCACSTARLRSPCPTGAGC